LNVSRNSCEEEEEKVFVVSFLKLKNVKEGNVSLKAKRTCSQIL